MMPVTSIAAEFRGSIATSIPQIVNLFKDDDLFKYNGQTVCWEYRDALLKLSKHGM
jgi:hypothetical protein